MRVICKHNLDESRSWGQESSSDRANWYALWVKSRHEFVVAQELGRIDIECFLPSIARVRQWKDRKKTVEYPLFPGYLFVHMIPETGAFLNIIKMPGSVCFVSLEPGKPTLLSPEEIASLKAMLGSGQPVDVAPAFKEGTPVRVKRGPLFGHIGVLVKRENQHMFFININILGRCVGVKICSEDVEQA